jgi:hypothetical protein
MRIPPRRLCTANAEEAATATTAGAEHSVVERDAPDLNTTQRTAKDLRPPTTPPAPGRPLDRAERDADRARAAHRARQRPRPHGHSRPPMAAARDRTGSRTGRLRRSHGRSSPSSAHSGPRANAIATPPRAGAPRAGASSSVSLPSAPWRLVLMELCSMETTVRDLPSSSRFRRGATRSALGVSQE